LICEEREISLSGEAAESLHAIDLDVLEGQYVQVTALFWACRVPCRMRTPKVSTPKGSTCC
jgi:hypothetical protein